jgi:hypothetical protein
MTRCGWLHAYKLLTGGGPHLDAQAKNQLFFSIHQDSTRLGTALETDVLEHAEEIILSLI